MLKKWLKKLPIPLTQNHRYDLQAKKVMKKVLEHDSCCIDIGCHEGEFLDLFLKYAPQGMHFGFEPIPSLYKKLTAIYSSPCQLFEVALSNKKGESSFNHVLSNPAYSGLKKRQYDHPNEKDTTIKVETDLLDNLIDINQPIDFIKIDVEGGEYQVLQGARKTIQKHKPYIIFEHGLGAADQYGTKPEMLYALLVEEYDLHISTMQNWLIGKSPFSKKTFEQHFYEGKDYYFMAYA